MCDPEQDASALLEAVWAEDDDDILLPVDPVRIARELGIKVLMNTLPTNVSGALRKQPKSDPVILLSDTDSRNRQRFTCAHELGHYLLRSKGDDESFSYIDYRDERSSSGYSAEERYANQFAAGLLMPSARVRRHHKRLGVPELAHKFGVSLEAMRYRLQNLGLA